MRGSRICKRMFGKIYCADRSGRCHSAQVLNAGRRYNLLLPPQLIDLQQPAPLLLCVPGSVHPIRRAHEEQIGSHRALIVEFWV